MTIRVYLDADGKWRWRLCARNSRKVAVSGESFSSHRSALRAARMMLSYLPKSVRLVDDRQH